MQLLHTTNQDFSAKFQTLVSDRREATVDVNGTVRDILADVKVRSNIAVQEYTSRVDHFGTESWRRKNVILIVL